MPQAWPSWSQRYSIRSLDWVMSWFWQLHFFPSTVLWACRYFLDLRCMLSAGSHPSLCSPTGLMARTPRCTDASTCLTMMFSAAQTGETMSAWIKIKQGMVYCMYDDSPLLQYIRENVVSVGNSAKKLLLASRSSWPIFRLPMCSSWHERSSAQMWQSGRLGLLYPLWWCNADSLVRLRLRRLGQL